MTNPNTTFQVRLTSALALAAGLCAHTCAIAESSAALPLPAPSAAPVGVVNTQLQGDPPSHALGFARESYRDSLSRVLGLQQATTDAAAGARIKERVIFDSAQIVEIARTNSGRSYAIHHNIETGEYEVVVSTPVSEALKAHRESRKRSKDHPVPDDEIERLPLVTIEFTPKTRSVSPTYHYGTFTSQGPANTEFKASFGGARLFRDSVEIEQVSSSTFLVSVNGGPFLGRQESIGGRIQLLFDSFESKDGILPRIRVEVTGDHKGFFFGSDLKAAKPTIFYLPKATLKRIAADIEMCRRGMRPATVATQR